jgi:hypothetical protein
MLGAFTPPSCPAKPGIHVFLFLENKRTWMPVASTGMTEKFVRAEDSFEMRE